MKWFKVVSMIVIMFGVLLFLAKLKWSNPDMTDTRLMIVYWKEYIFSIIICICAKYLINKELKK